MICRKQAESKKLGLVYNFDTSQSKRSDIPPPNPSKQLGTKQINEPMGPISLKPQQLHIKFQARLPCMIAQKVI